LSYGNNQGLKFIDLFIRCDCILPLGVENERHRCHMTDGYKEDGMRKKW